MSPRVDRLPDRIAAALLGAAAGEAAAEAPAGVGQMLDLAEALADGDGVDEEALRRRGLEATPAPGPAALLLRGVVVGLLSPLDRPRLRRDAWRAARVGGGDEGTALTVLATAVLAADLCRFDLDTALVRLRQTLLEEAPLALHARLQPVADGAVPMCTGDPGACLQMAITALDRGATLPDVVVEAVSYAGEVAPVAALAGALAGCRDGLDGLDEAWIAEIPAAQRRSRAATALAARGGVTEG